MTPVKLGPVAPRSRVKHTALLIEAFLLAEIKASGFT